MTYYRYALNLRAAKAELEAKRADDRARLAGGPTASGLYVPR